MREEIKKSYGTFGSLIKEENRWIIRVEYFDGVEVYPFPTQTAARAWSDRAHITIKEET